MYINKVEEIYTHSLSEREFFSGPFSIIARQPPAHKTGWYISFAINYITVIDDHGELIFNFISREPTNDLILNTLNKFIGKYKEHIFKTIFKG